MLKKTLLFSSVYGVSRASHVRHRSNVGDALEKLQLQLQKKLKMCTIEGSLFLDGGVSVTDRVFGEVLFKDTPELLHVWSHLPRHPLQVALSVLTNSLCCWNETLTVETQ